MRFLPSLPAALLLLGCLLIPHSLHGQITVTILHTFTGTTTDGATPQAGVIQATDGNFYGTTQAGGSANAGIIYKLTPTGTLTILHSFKDGSISADGLFPWAALIQASDGNLYGTTLSKIKGDRHLCLGFFA